MSQVDDTPQPAKRLALGRKRRAPQALEFRRKSVPPLAALLISVVLLLVFNFTNWRFLKLLETSKERDLIERLGVTSTMIIHDLKKDMPIILNLIYGRDRDDQLVMLESFSGTDTYHMLVERLNRMRVFGELAEVVLFTDSGYVIADSNGTRFPPDPYPYLELDRSQIQNAVRGGVASTRRYWASGEPYQRFYRAFSEEGRVMAILQLSISATYLQEMQSIRQQLFSQWVMSSVLLLLIGISIYRLFRYVVRLEKSAMQGLRVESMGALAGGVAHELRNPLAIIRVMAEEIRSESPVNSLSAENASDIVVEIDRVNELVSHFLSLSRPPGQTSLSSIDLAAELRRVLELMRKGAPANIEFRIDAPDFPITLRADEKSIRQLLLNLLINAREALPPDGGTVAVSVRERRNVAELHVVDTGKGIEPAEMDRIFEPFYTTKEMGTGLGLSISRSIVENLGGSISLSSTPGKGTTCSVTLPLSDSQKVPGGIGK